MMSDSQRVFFMLIKTLTKKKTHRSGSIFLSDEFQARIRSKVEMAIRRIRLDCARLNEPDAGTIDEIARCLLAAQRNGIELRLENPSKSLLELIEFCGLAEPLRIEPGREAEQREQPGGVEKERDVGDPTT
jgi:ABC-type transporter Mla MlaB component